MVGRRTWGVRPWLGIPIDWSNSLTRGLQDYWPSNEGAGGTLNSIGRRGARWTFGSTTAWASARYGTSVQFDNSVNSTLTTTDAGYYNLWTNTQPWTLSYWLYFVGLSNTFWTNLNTGSAFQGFENTILSTGFVRQYLINSFGSNYIQAVTNTNAMVSGTENHVCVTYSGSSNVSGLTFYLNGVPAAATTEANSLSATTAGGLTTFRIGSRNSGGSPNGAFWDFGIWDRALTRDEVQSLYGNPWQIFRATQRYCAPSTTTYFLWNSEVEDSFNVLTY